MAANTLTNILDKILARGLVTLREAVVMPRLVNVDFQGEGAQQGNTVDIPKPVAQVVSTVTASQSQKDAAAKTPGLVQVKLDQWKMTDFNLTDREMVEVDRNRHFLPMQTDEAARAIANDIDGFIHGKYFGIFGFVGTAAVIPFSTIATATDARKTLNTTAHLAPMNDRRVVLDPTAEGQALQLSAFADVSQSADRAVKIEGEIGRKLGLDFFMSQNVKTHTAGTVTSAAVASTTAAGASSIDVKAAASASIGTILLGDVFTIAGNSQTYAVQGSTTITLASSLAAQALSIRPGLAAIASANAAITFKATHVVNLAFQRNAFTYVTRPMAGADIPNPNPTRVLQDNETGLTMRLEVVRQHKQVAWQFDVLYGAELIRPELAVRIAG